MIKDLNLDLKQTQINFSIDKSIDSISTKKIENINKQNQEIYKKNIDLNSINKDEKSNILNDIASTLSERNEFKINNISFSYNNDANVFIVYVKDDKNNEVIRQFPTEDFIDKLKNFRKQEQQNLNLFLDQLI